MSCWRRFPDRSTRRGSIARAAVGRCIRGDAISAHRRASHAERRDESPDSPKPISGLADEVLLTYAKDDVLSVYLVSAACASRTTAAGALRRSRPGGARARTVTFSNSCAIADVVVSGGRALVIPIWVNLYQRTQPTGERSRVFADRYRRQSAAVSAGWRTEPSTTWRPVSDMDVQRLGFLGASAGAYVIAPAAARDGRAHPCRGSRSQRAFGYGRFRSRPRRWT